MELICTDRNGFRSVNDREAYALRYTFGVMVGSFLINTIKIKYDPPLLDESRDGRVISKTEILMQSNYNSEGLDWLGGFIHEVTHIWQRNTGLHREGKSGENYEYDYKQLLSLDLEIEEHARAVQDWFYVSYGFEHRLIGPGIHRMDFSEIQHRMRPIMEHDPGVEIKESHLRQFVEGY